MLTAEYMGGCCMMAPTKPVLASWMTSSAQAKAPDQESAWQRDACAHEATKRLQTQQVADLYEIKN